MHRADVSQKSTIRMIALDLDGTLLSSNLTIPPDNALAIREAASAGVAVVLASARPPRSMRRYHQELGLDTPVVACDGAITFDLVRNRTLESVPIPTLVARSAVAFLRKQPAGANLSLEMEDQWHVDAFTEDLQQAVRDYGLEPPHGIGTIDAILTSGDLPVLKILCGAAFLEPDAVKALDCLVRPAATARLTPGGLVEVTATAVSKARAVARLARALGVPAAQVLALGDGENDVPLLRWAGIAVAMANAAPSLQRVADEITLSNDAAGVAAAIRRFVLS